MSDDDKLGVKRENLQPGKRYRVEFSDCCVGGELIGVFVSHADEEYDDVIFDTGKINGFGSVHYYEVAD